LLEQCASWLATLHLFRPHHLLVVAVPVPFAASRAGGSRLGAGLHASSPTDPMLGMSGAAVTLSQVTVTVGGRKVLGPLDWTIERGERWALLGQNGAGKTTLLSILGAERHPTTGHATVLGGEIGRTDLRVLRQRIGHVGHLIADRLPRHEPVLDLVLTGKGSLLAPWWGEFDDEDRKRASEILHRLRCDHIAEQSFGRCSLGERQRVLLARALFARSELLLLDEPAMGVDLPGREALVNALDELARTPDAPTTVHVAHTLEELPAITHALVLRDGEVLGMGLAPDVLTSSVLSEAYGIDVRVSRIEGRFFATASGQW
jgi:iron complex transport system ATP-binding protein